MRKSAPQELWVIESLTGCLHFGVDWRRTFSVSLQRKDAAVLLGAHGHEPKALEGRLVRARGWIEQRQGAQGPMIDLSAAGDLEVLEAAPASPPEPATKTPGLTETGRPQ